MDPAGTSAAGLARTGDRLAVDRFWIDEEYPEPRTVVLGVHGEADLHVVDMLQERLGEIIEENPRAVVLDLTGTTFLDSTAMAVLLRAMKSLHAKGGRFRVVAPRYEIRRIFEMTLLDRVFDVDRSRQESVAAANGGEHGAGARL
jgi:anti-sigma B factor antagonist